jgi:hypothetical protein
MLLLNYLFGGFVIMFLFDLIASTSNLPFMGVVERVMTLIFWPILFVIFIVEIIRSI